ncbi:MAG: helix-turn-helix domain-containing protein, partial [Bdellovibrionota bacterium]
DALESAWASYETLKHHPHLVIYLHTLCTLGTIYSLKGDVACARLYLDLADRSLKRDEFPRIARLVDEALTQVRSKGAGPTDLSFDSKTGVLYERSKGEIRFEGQFILRDMLRVFLESPGRIFTKEDLARLVWREDYRTEIHDNKIYVTIKRLRKLLECEETKTDYILRAKTGYFLNPKTRVAIDETAIPAFTKEMEN